MGGKAEKIADIAAGHSKDGAAEFLERGVVTRQQFRQVVSCARDALYELFADDPNEKRMARKLKEAVMVYLDLDVERQVEDPIQSRAVKLLRENVIRQSEKEKLAEGLAALAIERWKTLSEDELEKLAEDDTGLLAVLLERTEIKVNPTDEELKSTLIETGKLLSLPFIRAVPPAELDGILKGTVRACELAAAGKSVAEQLQQTATAALEVSGAIRIMRKSFAGLLLGDMILRQVGKSLGVKEKVTVTDFIVFLGCLIADKQALPKVDKAEIRQLKEEIEGIL